MGKVDFRLKAVEDLNDISDYTLETWGPEQEVRYLKALDRALDRLAESPETGRACDWLREGYRKHLVGRHVVFYRLTAGGIEVVRVLHQSMDFERHL